MYASSPKQCRPLNMRFSKNPFLLHNIPNLKSVRCVVFEIQRSVSQWYLDFICIDLKDQSLISSIRSIFRLLFILFL
jgi:hypothetical protein